MLARKRRHLRTVLIAANVALVAYPSYAHASKGAALAAGCCIGAAGAAMVASAASTAKERRAYRRSHPVTEVHYHTPPPLEDQVFSRDEARAEILEAELWSRDNCEPDRPQPASARVFITFRGADGRATEVWFEPPLRGEAFSACMDRAFSTTRMTPFDQSDKTVSKGLGGGA
ncbi:MAG: hypothetical protein AAGA56_01220 [Myxococcota bacterium]